MTNKFMRTIRKLSDEELDVWESRLRTDLSKLRAEVSLGGSIRFNARIGNHRRNIARILTVKRERRNS